MLKNFDSMDPSKNVIWTTDYQVELPVRVKKHGPGSEKP
jgi:long-chain-fatty-acid--CoA ligase ACSBG